jgi:ABC-type Fe3+ transport system substrate-binding protein
LLAPYRSPEAKSFIPEFKDPNGYWTAIYINYASIGYNSKILSEKEAPKQWEDLLEPKWKGKFAIDQEQLVRHLAQSMGPRARAKIHARSGEAGDSVAQRTYTHRSTHGCR